MQYSCIPGSCEKNTFPSFIPAAPGDKIYALFFPLSSKCTKFRLAAGLRPDPLQGSLQIPYLN